MEQMELVVSFFPLKRLVDPNCKYICLHVGLIPVYLLSENGVKIKGD